MDIRMGFLDKIVVKEMESLINENNVYRMREMKS